MSTERVSEHRAHLQRVLKEVIDIFNKVDEETIGYYATEAHEINKLTIGFKSIISAIRGPDFKINALTIKQQTTAKLRYAIGMRESSMLDVNPEPFNWRDFERTQRELDDTSPHFAYHIKDAAIGIEWLLDVKFPFGD